MSEPAPGDRVHPVQVVVRRTGLSPELLRTWERRYTVVTPARSPSGRRLYSDDDIERLRLLRRAIGLGWSIGQVARQSTDALRALVVGTPATAEGVSAQSPAWPRVEVSLDGCLAAIEALDASALDAALSMVMVVVGRDRIVEDLVVPLMREVGRRWHDGSLRVANEHLASTVLSAFLSAMRKDVPSPETAPTLIVTTPMGQTHELGALAAAVIASVEGWRVSWIGANLKASEIALAARRLEARAVALSISSPADDPALAGHLWELADALPPGTLILAGGDAANAYRETLYAIGAVILGDLAHFRATLGDLLRQAEA